MTEGLPEQVDLAEVSLGKAPNLKFAPWCTHCVLPTALVCGEESNVEDMFNSSQTV